MRKRDPGVVTFMVFANGDIRPDNSGSIHAMTGCNVPARSHPRFRPDHSAPINRTTQRREVLLHRLVLASGSETRRKMLQDAGIPFDSEPVRIDEGAIRSALEAEGASPRDVADALAEFKARKAEDRHPGTFVLGSDQVLALKGRIFGKPASRDEAASHLQDLEGKTHMLLSAAVIYHDGAPVWRGIGQARLTMHALSSQEIETYLDRAWPGVEGSVGAYHAEGYGARLFSRIDGDWFSVLGLPLLDICSFLRLRGLLQP